MLPILVPILTSLAASGLDILAGAIKAKGKEFVEDKIGVKIPLDGNLSPELLQELKIKEMEHESELLELSIRAAEQSLEGEKAAQSAVTSRWEADMNSDSYLAKNIRPWTLLFILSVYTLFGLLSAVGVNVNPTYVTLLGQWGVIIMSAYFVGRTIEKVKAISE